MSQPYFGGFDDGEGTASHPVPGLPGATERADYLSPWYTPGYVAHLGPDGSMVYTDLLPGSSAVDFAQLPADQLNYRTVTQRYFSPDGDPLGGFLTFMPSSAFTITEDGVTYRIPRRLAGTETYPALDSGVSPWAFSMEGSGRIFIWLGLMVVRLYPTDSPNVTTDDGNPLTYHVIEHFIGGRQFDITVPTGDTTLDLYSSIVPGSIHPSDYDPVFPMGSLLGTDLWDASWDSALPAWSQSSLTTQYLPVTVGATTPAGDPIDVTSDTIEFAFTNGTPSLSADWIAGEWVSNVSNPYQAQVLIGPANGGVALSQGSYQIWIRLTDTPQIFVLQVGTLTIT